jgi:hypothetical protein
MREFPKHDLSEQEMRALAAIRFFGGFGPFTHKRDTLIAALAAKGLVTAGVPGVWEVASTTEEGRAELQRIYFSTFFKNSEEWTPFEQELINAMSREGKKAWDDAERELPNVPAPPRGEMH